MKKLLLLCAVSALLCAPLSAAERTEATSATVTTTTNSAAAVAANPKRNLLILQNNSNVAISCKFGATAVAGEGIVLSASGGNLFMDAVVDPRVLNCINASGNKDLNVIEGIRP